MSADKVHEGDKVSWNWGGSHPSGTVSEVKPGEVTVVSHRGNEISKSGTESNPAVHISRSGNDVVKTASELHVDKKSEQNGSSAPSEEEKEEKKEHSVTEKKEESNEIQDAEDAQPGDKRKADEKADDKTEPEKPAAKEPDGKKQKTINGDSATPNPSKKGPGRPKGAGGDKKAPKKEKKVPRVGTAARQTRSQGTAK